MKFFSAPPLPNSLLARGFGAVLLLFGVLCIVLSITVGLDRTSAPKAKNEQDAFKARQQVRLAYIYVFCGGALLRGNPKERRERRERVFGQEGPRTEPQLQLAAELYDLLNVNKRSAAIRLCRKRTARSRGDCREMVDTVDRVAQEIERKERTSRPAISA